jgi:transcriptional antiterminator RfaH
MGWYVLYTKPKMEIRVAQRLNAANFEVYCPTTKQTRKWSDRMKKVEVPLFNSYVFIRLKQSERSKVFDFPGVLRYLYWLGKPAIARDEEIELIKSWLDDDDFDDLLVEQISPGDLMKIKSGPFKNKEGIVKNVGPKRLKLALKQLGIIINVRLKECV